MLKDIKKNLDFYNLPKVKYIILNIILAILFVIPNNFTKALISKNMVNAAIEMNINYIYKALYILGIMFLMNGVLYPYLIMKLNNMILSRDTQLRYGIYKHVSKLEMKVIEKYHSGDMLSRINDDM